MPIPVITYVFVCACFFQESIDLGEIMFSLCYLPTAGRMTLTVIKCRNLKAMDITGSSGKCNVPFRLASPVGSDDSLGKGSYHQEFRAFDLEFTDEEN